MCKYQQSQLITSTFLFVCLSAADIPVRIDWSVLDDQMLSDFWHRHKQLIAATSSSIDELSSSSSNSNSDNTTRAQQIIEPSEQQQLGQAEVILKAQQTTTNSNSNSSGKNHQWQQQQLLTIDKLPDFFDRLLVFHRGVGVSTAEGLYLDKKIDLLLGYIFVDPIVNSWKHLIKQITALKDDIMSRLTWGDDKNDQKQQQQEVLRPFAAADLGHAYVRSVVRQSLRVIMPGPAEVLQHFGDQLTLVVSFLNL